MCSVVRLLIVRSVLAQSGTSAIYGKVTDQQGGALPGVTVTITSTATGLARSSVTDASGDFQILAVPPGKYTVKVELQNFRTAVRENVELLVDARTKMDVPMELGSMSETIEVTGTSRRSTPPTPASATSSAATRCGRSRSKPNNVVGLLRLQAGVVYAAATQ